MISHLLYEQTLTDAHMKAAEAGRLIARSLAPSQLAATGEVRVVVKSARFVYWLNRRREQTVRVKTVTMSERARLTAVPLADLEAQRKFGYDGVWTTHSFEMSGDTKIHSIRVLGAMARAFANSMQKAGFNAEVVVGEEVSA